MYFCYETWQKNGQRAESEMELCYMNKTNISWLRNNRELYFIEIEIKRGADQQPQRLVNDSVPPFDGLLLNGRNLTVDAVHLVADLFRFFLGDQRMILRIVHGVAYHLLRQQTDFVIALDLSPLPKPRHRAKPHEAWVFHGSTEDAWNYIMIV